MDRANRCTDLIDRLRYQKSDLVALLIAADGVWTARGPERANTIRKSDLVRSFYSIEILTGGDEKSFGAFQ